MNENRDVFIEKRVARQKKIRKRRLKIAFIFTLLVAIAVGVVLSLTVFFKVNKVTSTGSKIYTSAEVVNAANIGKEENLFMLTESEVLKRVKAKLPYVEKVSLERTLPDSLKVIVTDAIEIIAVERNGEYYKVSTSNAILGKAVVPPSETVIVSGAEFEGNVGESITYKETDVEEALEEILRLLDKKNISLQYIDFYDQTNLIIGVENKFKVKLGAKINIKEKINHLEAMLEELKEENSGTINLSVWTKDNKKGTFSRQN